MRPRCVLSACLALCLAACVAPPDPEHLMATEVAVRVAVAATLTAQAPPPEEIAFQSWRDGNWEIYLMDTEGANQRNLTQHAADDTHPAWSPDGETLAFASDREAPGGLYTMAADGTDVRLLRAFDTPIVEIVWSPDGTHLAVVLHTYPLYATWVIPASGGQGVRLAADWQVVQQPSWSADSRRLALLVAHGARPGPVIVDREGDETRFVWPEDEQCVSVAWSPDGETLALGLRRYPAERVRFVRPSGEPREDLPIAEGIVAGRLAWSADGTGLYALDYEPSNNLDVLHVDLGTGNRRWLDADVTIEGGVAPSPDGQRLAYAVRTAGGMEIAVLRLEDGAVHMLTRNDIADQHPAWRPTRSTGSEVVP